MIVAKASGHATPRVWRLFSRSGHRKDRNRQKVKQSEVSEQTVGILLQNVYAQRQSSMDAMDAIDAKAGILLGFSGVLIALVYTMPLWWVRLLVVVPCASCAALSFIALLVRRVPTIRAKKMRDRYLTETPAVTGRVLLDTLTHQQEDLEAVQSKKANLVTCALYALVLAIALTTVVVVITGGRP